MKLYYARHKETGAVLSNGPNGQMQLIGPKHWMHLSPKFFKSKRDGLAFLKAMRDRQPEYHWRFDHSALFALLDGLMEIKEVTL